MSGVVEETPGRLEYEVALYKEAPARKTNSSSELPVDQAVPIGTKLQLRARINPQSGKHLPRLNSLSVTGVVLFFALPTLNDKSSEIHTKYLSQALCVGETIDL